MKLCRNKKSPYIPEVKDCWDATNFDAFEQEEPWIPEDIPKSATKKKNKMKKKNTEFIGYTYKPIEAPNSGLLKALLDLENINEPVFLSEEQKNLDYLQLEGGYRQVYGDHKFTKNAPVNNPNINVNLNLNVNFNSGFPNFAVSNKFKK